MLSFDIKTLIMDDTLSFITEVIQRGRIKPAKYKHYLKMPREIYDLLRKENIIQPEYYFIEKSIFFEYDKEIVTLNFINISMCDDFHIKFLTFLIKKQLGYSPITRGGFFF